MKTEQLPDWIRLEQKLPIEDERVIVVCEGYRCLGYLDTKGIWRQDKDKAPIEDVIGWGKLRD